MTAARLELAAGNPEAALERLARVEPNAVHTVSALEHAVLEAIARESAGEPGRAGEALERALDIAERSGHRWTFLEGGRRSIYRKLDVARRREAVDRARDLRLLSAPRR